MVKGVQEILKLVIIYKEDIYYNISSSIQILIIGWLIINFILEKGLECSSVRPVRGRKRI